MGAFSPTASHDHGLFANIPSINYDDAKTSSASLEDARPDLHRRRPSAVSDRAIMHSPDQARPRTADPAVARRRSKTTPQFGPSTRIHGTMNTDEKPLPLAFDVDAKRQHPPVVAADAPPTIGDKQSLAPKFNPKARNQYSLVPTPSLGSKHSKTDSKSSTLSRGPSNASNTPSGRRPSWSTSQSNTNRDTPQTSMHPSVRSSILDEVEGTLSATITELQGLQGNWHHESTRMHTPSPFRPSSTGHHSIRSARSSQDHGYFPVMPVQSHSPLLHSPMRSSPLTVAADGPVPNMQQVYNEQKKHTHAVLLENDAIKRKLDAMCKQLAEFEEEKASLALTAKETQETLQSILTRLREAKVAEQAASNELLAAKSDLEKERKRSAVLTLELEIERKASKQMQGKLEEKNVQNVELLERDFESQSEMTKLRQELANMKKQHIAATQSDDQSSENASTIAMMNLKLEDMQRQLCNRDALVSSLRQQNEEATRRMTKGPQENQDSSMEYSVANLRQQLDASRQSNSPSAELQARLSRIEEELRIARVERDQFSSLLHAEIRRTAIEEHNREHPSSAFLKKRADLAVAVEAARQRAHKYLGLDNRSVHEDHEDLYREIEYYLNDIVLYKLDVKGYKKDLRVAREQIKELSASRVNNVS